MNDAAVVSWSRARTLDDIPERVRTVTNSSEVTSTASTIRHECIKAAMGMVRKMEPMSFGDRFDATVRGVMAVRERRKIK